MIFNSIEFAIFLPIVFGIYWMLQGSVKRQNFFLLIASYFFYGWWDWRFLFLIALSSSVDFIVGQRIHQSENRQHQKYWLWLSLAVNLGLLGYFKYYNFFLENFVEAFTLLGSPFEAERLHIILPVGISFYTFQTLSYTIDIYKGRMKPTNNPVTFFAYVSFFPQLVAGPIERARKLIPQFSNSRHFDYAKAVDGMRQILWGLFKKVVIADNCAPYVQDIFGNIEGLHSPMLFIGMFLFIFQLYADFSGYSDIAIGTARLFGFSLSKNFNFPAYAVSIPDFWRRWHITMTTWFRDYVYLPLFGKKRNEWVKFRNVLILFLVIGFWHGAKWTFILYGFINAMLFYFQNKINKSKYSLAALQKNYSHEIVRHFRMFTNYFLLMTSSIFFRAENVSDSINYVLRMFSPKNWFIWDVIPSRVLSLRFVVGFVILCLIFEYFNQNSAYGLEMKHYAYRKKWIRWSVYIFILVVLFQYRGVELDFIYFQF